MQKELRRFTHRTDEQQDRDQVRGVPVGPKETNGGFRQLGCCGEDIVELDRVGQIEQAKDTKRKAEVTDTVDHKRLDRRRIRRGLLVVEADQQIGRDAHAFPAKKHLNKVVRCHEHQHREGEERQIGEETGAIGFGVREILVMGHVAEGIEVDEAGDRGDHDQHDRGQTVEADRPIGRQAAAFDPAQDLDVLCFTVKRKEDDPA